MKSEVEQTVEHRYFKTLFLFLFFGISIPYMFSTIHSNFRNVHICSFI